MNDKDKIIKRLTLDTGISDQHIRVIIDDIFYGMLTAMQTNYSVEMSGFGRWYYNYNKSKKELIKIINKLPETSSERQREILISIGKDIIKKLKDEDYQLAADFRRVEEQINSTRGTENSNWDYL